MDRIHVDALLFVLGLLQLEDEIVKVPLQLFVAIVDAQLLERIYLKAFKAENVQYADAAQVIAFF